MLTAIIRLCTSGRNHPVNRCVVLSSSNLRILLLGPITRRSQLLLRPHMSAFELQPARMELDWSRKSERSISIRTHRLIYSKQWITHVKSAPGDSPCPASLEADHSSSQQMSTATSFASPGSWEPVPRASRSCSSRPDPHPRSMMVPRGGCGLQQGSRAHAAAQPGVA